MTIVLPGGDHEFAVVVFKNFVGHGQAQAEANGAGDKKRFQGAFGGFGSEARSVVLNIEVDPSMTMAVGFYFGVYVYVRLGGVRLNGVEEQDRKSTRLNSSHV